MENRPEIFQLPTPHPSSCTFHEPPSPVQQHETLPSPTYARISYDGTWLLIGRSSVQCDLALSPKNKLVSRIHAKVRYLFEEHAFEVRCVGFNGLSLHIGGQSVHVKRSTGVLVHINSDEASFALDVAGSYVDLIIPSRPEEYDDVPMPSSPHEIEQVEEKALSPTQTNGILTPGGTPIKQTLLTSLRSSPLGQHDAVPKKLFDCKGKENDPPEQEGPDAEFVDMILTTLASSIVSPAPISHFTPFFPSSTSVDEIEDFLRTIEPVSEVPRLGKDASGVPLRSTWYYEPSRDPDLSRRTRLEVLMKPVRKTRKQHVQYYWKPVHLRAPVPANGLIEKSKRRRRV